MASLFSRIVAGEVPAHKLAEDDRFLAFLDIMPLVEGHALVIPKQEVSYLFDLDEETYAGLLLFARRLAPAIQRAVPCQRIGVAVIGLEVPHVHIHLVPLNTIQDINFTRPKLTPTADALAAVADRIRAQLA